MDSNKFDNMIVNGYGNKIIYKLSNNFLSC